MAAILEVSGLKKSYKNFELKNVSFSIYEDCITGFIGVNGAGKTTTINALLNLVHRDDNWTTGNCTQRILPEEENRSPTRE